MDEVENLFIDGKLLARAMEYPMKLKDYYDCSTWGNEFSMMMNNNYSSVSSTLIIPNVGVALYKSIGFLVNSDLVDCHHISKSDSASCGNVNDNNFMANKADFNTIDELATYIRNNKSTALNEVNFNGNINAVVGLFAENCINERASFNNIVGIYVIQKFLEMICNINFPIYLYDKKSGMIKKLQVTKEMENQINDAMNTHNVFYWPEDLDEPIIENILDLRNKSL